MKLFIHHQTSMVQPFGNKNKVSLYYEIYVNIYKNRIKSNEKKFSAMSNLQTSCCLKLEV